jgi:hypothetical protein
VLGGGELETENASAGTGGPNSITAGNEAAVESSTICKLIPQQLIYRNKNFFAIKSSF